MSDSYQWSESTGFADLYEKYFVPALFGDWAIETVRAGRIQPNERVLDVACGTGVVAREAARLASEVTGIDQSGEMLATAKRSRPSIDWRQADAAELPFDDHSFDVVFCQFALMFMQGKEAALREMKRVGGRMVVVVWESVERSPGYREFTEMLEREHSRTVADILRSPFSMGNKDELTELYGRAGIDCEIVTKATQARFASLRDWVEIDVRATPMSDLVSDAELLRLIDRASGYLGAYRQSDGSVRFDAPAHLLLTPSR